MFPLAENAIPQRTKPLSGLGWTVLRFAMAVIILIAAVLKAWQLAAMPSLGEGLLHARWFNMLVVEFELLFGIWLVSGLLPKLARLAAIGCFSIFAAVSLYKALSGEVSCGCFGALTVNPWITAGLDIVIVGCLLFIRPVKSVLTELPQINVLERYWFLRTFLMTFVLCLVVTVQVYLFFGSFIGLGNFMTVQEVAFNIDQSFETQDDNVVGIAVENKTDAKITLVGAKTDCGCGKIEGIPQSVSPHSQSHVLFVASEGADKAEKAKQKQRIVFFVDGKGTHRAFTELPLFEFLAHR